MLNWPPPYQIIKSLRAKQIRLSIHPGQGLRIHIPDRLRKPVDIPALLLEKKSWILKHAALLSETSEPLESPQTLALTAISELWTIEYQQKCSRASLFAKENHSIVIMNKTTEVDSSIRLLHHWLKQKAEKHLGPWLKQLSQEHDLPYQAMQVRKQKTLWGSCSRDKIIRLNYKLLFLPSHLTEHVLLHELSHLKHLHHGPEFWALLSELDPHCMKHHRALNSSDAKIPAWL